MATNFASGLWRLADPKISLASMASLFLGACASAAAGPLHWGWLALTVLGIFCIEVAKNASGEIFDFDSGADPGVAPEHLTPFSGGKRVLVEALLTRRQTIGIAAVTYLLGIAIGLAIVVYREPMVLWLGMIGVGAAYFYNGAPLRAGVPGTGGVDRRVLLRSLDLQWDVSGATGRHNSAGGDVGPASRIAHRSVSLDQRVSRCARGPKSEQEDAGGPHGAAMGQSCVCHNYGNNGHYAGRIAFFWSTKKYLARGYRDPSGVPGGPAFVGGLRSRATSGSGTGEYVVGVCPLCGGRRRGFADRQLTPQAILATLK